MQPGEAAVTGRNAPLKQVRRPARVTRRAVLAGLGSVAGSAIGRSVPAAHAGTSLPQDVAATLMLGFTGTTTRSPDVKTLRDHLGAGRIAGIVFRKMNIGSRDDVLALVRAFSDGGTRPLLAIDHEGGFVQRLVGPGFTPLPPAHEVAKTLSTDEALGLYAQAAAEVAAIGFNLNLGPVLDLHDSRNPQIGHFGRAFDEDPDRTAAYAEAFVDGFASEGILCALKHFPGEGKAHDDSHDELPDLTDVWSDTDIAPYRRLIANGRARVVMMGHVRLSRLDPTGIPVSLSRPVVTGLLRDQLGFRGVAMTDDIDMAAIRSAFPREQAFVGALAAGNDLVMVGNTDLVDPELPDTLLKTVDRAIANGRLSASRVAEAAQHVRALRSRLD